MIKINLEDIAFVALGTALRAYGLGLAPFWYDEAFTALVVSLPLDRMITAIHGDVHPPLYYLLTSGWSRLFGTGEIALRSLSVFFSVLTMITIMLVTKRLAMTRLQRAVTSGLIAILPAQIYYAQEARMYASLSFLLALSLLCVVSRRYIWLTVVTILALYTHNYALLIWPGVWIWALANEVERPVRIKIDEYTQRMWSVQGGFRWLPGDESRFMTVLRYGVLAVLAWLPWGIFGLWHQMQIIGGGNYWIVNARPGAFVQSFFQQFLAETTPDKLQPLAVIMSLALMWYALAIAFRDRNMIAMVWGLPVLFVAAANVIFQPVILQRGFVPLGLVMAILVGQALKDRESVLYAGVLMIPLFAYCLFGHYTGIAVHKNDNKTDIFPAILKSGMTRIVHTNDGSLIQSMYYLPQYDHYLLDTGCPPLRGALSYETRDALGVKYMQPHEVKDATVVFAIGPMSSQCEEQVLGTLANGWPTPVWDLNDKLGLFTLRVYYVH